MPVDESRIAAIGVLSYDDKGVTVYKIARFKKLRLDNHVAFGVYEAPGLGGIAVKSSQPFALITHLDSYGAFGIVLCQMRPNFLAFGIDVEEVCGAICYNLAHHGHAVVKLGHIVPFMRQLARAAVGIQNHGRMLALFGFLDHASI